MMDIFLRRSVARQRGGGTESYKPETLRGATMRHDLLEII